MTYELLATAPAGAAELLAAEIVAAGGSDCVLRPWGAYFRGGLRTAYELCLWSRVASRVLLKLGAGPAANADELYASAAAIDWSLQLDEAATLAVDFESVGSALTHTRFGALKVKDAIVDQLRAKRGTRPQIDTDRPGVRVSVRVARNAATFSLDLSGDSLQRRGWRGAGVAAPLKENLAATLLLRCGWPAIAADGGDFVDPMCGSGTLPIEAALIAADRAPGLTRSYFGFLGWAGHDAALWREIREAAVARAAASRWPAGRIFGSDADARAVEIARIAAVRAGVGELIAFERRPLAQLRAPSAAGLLLVNPPYGERLGEAEALRPLYAELGAVLRERFLGWQAGVLTGNALLGRELKLEARRSHRLYNGPLEVQLLRFTVAEAHFTRSRRPGRLPAVDPARRDTPGAQMFGNRLRKNLDALGRWARREGIACFRVYDADMPEYAFAIDLYANGERYACVQEYAAPASVAEDRVRARRAEAVSVLPEVLGLPEERIWFRTRRRQKGAEQYRKLADQQSFHEVAEGGLRFLVNFDDYLDTGLFLDHRLTRARLRGLAAGRRFLNLFGYTGTATVYTAAGGASSTTTVDLSRTYLDWAQRNLELNGFTGREHVLTAADVLEWLKAAPAAGWDLIFLDPPTFSNSKKMRATLDLQRDHVALIQAAARLLAPGGELVFSTNFSRFALDAGELSGLAVENITRQTLPKDFERNPRIHSCFAVRHATERAGRS